MLEKRSGDPRDACAISAQVLVEDNGVPANCVVTDISVRGACIRLDTDLALPDRFILALPLIDEMHDNRIVELRWTQGRTAGVSFKPETTHTGEPPAR